MIGAKARQAILLAPESKLQREVASVHGSLPQEFKMSSTARRDAKRRPSGLSRRRKRHFTFEPLEDRRVMSAESPVAPLVAPVNFGMQATSYSSDTLEGQYQQLLNELNWHSLMTSSGGSLQAMSIPTDPMLANQWHLINSGQTVGSPDYQPIYGTAGEDINVAPVWNTGYTGQGVSVAVIDSGVELSHPDLAANIDLSRQFNANLQTPNGSPVNPALDPSASHGTAVAGLIAAVANNGIGGAGVAPGATIVPINLLSGQQTAAGTVNAIRFAIANGVDITNNSYGAALAGGRSLFAATPEEVLALRDSVIFGRNGLGLINVFAAGNSAGQYVARPGFDGLGVFSSSSYYGLNSSRYGISVTGVDHDGSYNNVDGTVTNYMEIGPAVLVAAPTGSVALTVGLETGTGSGIYTTDLTRVGQNGDEIGYNIGPDPDTGAETDRDFYANTDYTSRFNGTSAAAPIVSGVIALMLEANPNLTWREVQEILIRSARQNDQFGIPTSGAGYLGQTTWITNQNPVFLDLDAGLGGVSGYLPSLDPNLAVQVSIAPDGKIYSDRTLYQPTRMATGAGYTVSQGYGIYNEQIGYAHGVVDADLAVKMAEQWHTKGQGVANERTFTTYVDPRGSDAYAIPAAEITNDAAGLLVVPGGIGGDPGFIAWYNEQFADNPDFGGLTYDRGSSLQFSVPASQTMSIESVDVKLSIGGDAAAALDHLRIMLVSPTGTYSEFMHWNYDVYADNVGVQSIGGQIWQTPGGSTAPANGFIYTFNTKRSWGERSDDAISFNPSTNEPWVDETGTFGNIYDTLFTSGEALTQGWRLVIENWSSSASFTLDGVEIAWHGSPISAQSKRVQGFVGVDDNRDNLFNFSRVVTSDITVGGSPVLGDIIATPDLTQETFGANVTVTARRASDNVIVDQFVTGHDGNFYFDLVPDDYIISIEDPAGRSAIEDTLTSDSFLDHYRTEWLITEDYFRVWDHDPLNPNEVLVDANGDPLPWFDSQALPQTAEYGMTGINFLLDPGAVQQNEVLFTGSVYADITGNGAYDGDDIYLPSVIVFADINRDGVQNSGEVSVQTDAAGNYSLLLPLASSAVMNIGVRPPTGWTATKPITSASPNPTLFTVFAQPGQSFDLADFALKPPANNTGTGGANQVGTLLGVVYNDQSPYGGARQASEGGAQNVTVYIDANNNGTKEANEISTTTNEHGAFVFTSVTPGQKVVRIVVNSPMVQTAPAPGTGRLVALTGSSTFSGIQFGVRNTATHDYGDLPAIYGATTLAQNGARHRVGGYYLGAPGSNDIDAELDGAPSANANGDDLAAPSADEDGIIFGTIVPGSTVQLTVQASQSGYLQGWIDWNNDGDFNDVGERVLTNEGLVAGTNIETISVPAGANVAQVYARFRFGGHSDFTPNVGTIFGEASFGEVEDYQLNVAIPSVPQFVGLTADSNSDGRVNGMDFLTWQRNLGRNSGATQAQGDNNGDGKVDAADLVNLIDDFGAGSSLPAAPVVASTADFDGDGMVTGNDFLALQRGLGLAHPSVGAGDGNYDGTVNGADFDLWKQNVGTGTATSSFVASAEASTQTSVVALGGSRAYAAAVADNALAVAEDAPAVSNSTDARSAFNGKPFSAAGEARAQRTAYRPAGQSVEAKFADVVAQLHAADYVDRAFDDLLGSRRRQGLQAEVELLEAGDDIDCDEAFALLADHFDWTAG
jgi:subtilisin family serine protease